MYLSIDFLFVVIKSFGFTKGNGFKHILRLRYLQLGTSVIFSVVCVSDLIVV